jgi:hypothetical protein
MDLDYNDTFGFRIIEEIDDLDDLEEFEYPPVKRSYRRERQVPSTPAGKGDRIETIKEAYARAQKLGRDELKILRTLPRFQKKIKAGKNWTLSEDLLILTFSGSRTELSRRLQRSTESIRKRLAVLRQYGLHCKN